MSPPGIELKSQPTNILCPINKFDTDQYMKDGFELNFTQFAFHDQKVGYDLPLRSYLQQASNEKAFLVVSLHVPLF